MYALLHSLEAFRYMGGKKKKWCELCKVITHSLHYGLGRKLKMLAATN